MKPVLWILAIFVSYAYSASFYGASYISIPFQEAKKSTDISFRLKTYRSDAILLLVAGNTDYCLVLLVDGALKVRINLGSGEFEVSSTPRLRLDDLLWHTVDIKRQTSEVTLKIDNIHISKQTLPGRFHELNIHHGLYVGGLGDFKDLFLGLLQNFRGCLDQIIYNGMDIIKEAKKSSSETYAINWDCVDEFDAPVDSTVSFVTTRSYMAFPRPFDRSGGVIQFELRTIAEDALLVYNSGPPSKSDFISVEIVGKKLNLIIDKGKGATQLNSSLKVSDGKWHRISLSFSPAKIEAAVDDQIEAKSILEVENKYLDMSGLLYIGGLEVNRISKAVHQGAVVADKNFAGCIRNIRVNSRFIGIRDPQVTSGITVGCKWEYPCFNEPCIENATCYQHGLDGFRCDCDEEECVKPDYSPYTVSTRSTVPTDVEILSLTALRVEEGGEALITVSNLQITLDYEKYGIRDSGIVFKVVEPPKRGKLIVDIWPKMKNNMFTLLDVIQDKVSYSNDGSESPSDSIRLQMRLVTQKGYILPSHLQVVHHFSLPVSIIPVNDPPTINLPPGRVLRIPKNTKEKISNFIFNATDPDSPVSSLRYNILTLREGRIEHSLYPEKPAYSFTQEDVNEGLISYEHRGGSESQMIYKVSDGISDSSNAILRIAAYDLQVYLVNNTGLRLAHNTKDFITVANLSCTTNSIRRNQNIGYRITTPPRYGLVQVLKNSRKWHTVSHFTQRQLEKLKVRYEHTTKKPATDEFRFRVIVGDKEFSMEYSFRISFVSLTVSVVKNAPLLIDRITESFISEGFLRSITQPSQASPSDIVYTLVSPPHYGSIFKSSADLLLQLRLTSSSNFTQEDIAKGRIKYKLHHKTFSQFHDAFEFIVSSKGQSSNIHIFNIRYKPPKIDSPIFVKDLRVSEGGKERITDRYIVTLKNVSQLVFNVTSSPKHGVLFINDDISHFENNVTQFTHDDIIYNHLYYKHDDTENFEDNFYFVAFSADQRQDFQYVGMMNFVILSENDNPPKRLVEKVLNVVTNSERILTAKDLIYIDPDKNTPAESVVFTRHKVKIGEFYLLNNRSTPVYKFTQKQIYDKQIVFRHYGSVYGKVFITVSDGELETNGVIEIVASDPFIEIFNNSGIIAPVGGKATITNHNLSIETNLNAWGKSVTYKVLQSPKHGYLMIQGKKKENFFTDYDLETGQVVYFQNGKPTEKDAFKFRVFVGDTATEGIFDIKIYPASYWDNLQIISNVSLLVEEGSESSLDQSFLYIIHPDIPPSKIIYHITEPPKGRLEIDKSNALSNNIGYDEYALIDDPDYDDYYLVSEELIFTQEMIDEGRVKYVDRSSNLTEDYFMFDVTNGIRRLDGLRFNINIIPKTVYVSAGALTLEEGKAATLSTSLITILSPYYRDRLNNLIVTDFPHHGYLQRVTQKGVKVDTFTKDEMEKGLIQYVHDGTETERDSFSIVALSELRQSAPVKVIVTIKRLNDEIPKIIRKGAIQLWEGETIPIGNKLLAVYDEDTLPQHIFYKVIAPDCGFLSVFNNLSDPILKFSQEDVDENKVFFTHTGPLQCSIEWEATDGEQTTGTQYTSVKAKSLHLHIVNMTPLYVFPLMHKILTSNNILIATNANNLQRSITYSVRRSPKKGKLLLLGFDGTLRVTNNFTQRDINNSRVYYQHTKSFHDLSSDDSFTFDVKTPFADTLRDQEIIIHITVGGREGGELEKYLNLEPLVVIEGGETSIIEKNINLTAVSEFLIDYTGTRHSHNLVAKIVAEPKHGQIKYKENNFIDKTEIRITDIEQKLVTYTHDGSDTVFDRIFINIYLFGTSFSTSDILLYSGPLNITISPVNDQIFTLVSDHPQIEVVRGQTVVITRNDLLTLDADNGPDELVYEVMSGPDYGRVVSSKNWTLSFSSFTQKDINDGYVAFSHDGSNSSAKFYFQVSDGKHQPKYTVFSVVLVELTMKLENHTIISLEQGSTVAQISNAQLAAITNAERSMTVFNITKCPRYGGIFIGNDEITEFTQADIDEKKVVYVQNEYITSWDSFIIDIKAYDHHIRGIEVKIIIKPLVKTSPLQAPLGGRTPILLENLNATMLADKTGSTPFYHVVKDPRFGKIIKRNKRSSPRSVHVKQFTHEDVKKGRIFYVTRKLRLKRGDTIQDSLHFVLGSHSAKVQPAQGILTIQIITSVLEDSVESRRLRPGKLPENPAAPSRPNPEVIAQSNGQNIATSIATAIAIIVGIIILIVIVIIAVACFIRRRHPKKDKKCAINTIPNNSLDTDVASLPPPAITDSRPNSFMTEGLSEDDPPHSPALLLHTHPRSPPGIPVHLSDQEASWHKEGAVDFSPTIPNCKITQLCPETSCPSVCQSPCQPPPSLAGYPYGADPEQVEEWSMYESQPVRSTNPMLRKNQYWV